MRFLLDTHVLLWLLGDHERVPSSVRERLADQATQLLVSAVSGLEIATKVRLGKLDAGDLTTTLAGRLLRIGAAELPITMEHALLAGSLTWQHRDPFDRLLIAQASVENATLVTVDRALAGLPTPSILTW